jgi:hypothetical protein
MAMHGTSTATNQSNYENNRKKTRISATILLPQIFILQTSKDFVHLYTKYPFFLPMTFGSIPSLPNLDLSIFILPSGLLSKMFLIPPLSVRIAGFLHFVHCPEF